MTIQEVATQTGVSAYTIRFYEKMGVLTPITRLPSGIRNFTKEDVSYLRFLLQLKQTGMSLADIMAFTKDGCMLQRLSRGEAMPPAVVAKRTALLRHHERHLLEQRRELDALLCAVQQKMAFYEDYAHTSAAANASVN